MGSRFASVFQNHRTGSVRWVQPKNRAHIALLVTWLIECSLHAYTASTYGVIKDARRAGLRATP